MPWRSTLVGYAAGSLAACGAVTVSNPAEVVKTRLQLHGELAAQARGAPRPSLVAATLRIARTEGLRALQRGLGAAYVYQIAMNGTRLGSYEPIKRVLRRARGGIPAPHDPAWLNAMAGALAGMVGAAISSPFNLVKVRMQVGGVHAYRNVLHGLRAIAAHEGVRGLYRGVDAAMARTCVGSAAQLASYDHCKRLLRAGRLLPRDGPALYLTASLATSGIVCVAMNPLDVVLTRMYNQSGAAPALYANPVDCALKTVRAEGPLALFKGLSAHYMRLGPHTIITLVLMEVLRDAMHRWVPS